MYSRRITSWKSPLSRSKFYSPISSHYECTRIPVRKHPKRDVHWKRVYREHVSMQSLFVLTTVWQAFDFVRSLPASQGRPLSHILPDVDLLGIALCFHPGTFVLRHITLANKDSYLFVSEAARI